jgi:hypothetical protein
MNNRRKSVRVFMLLAGSAMFLFACGGSRQASPSGAGQAAEVKVVTKGDRTLVSTAEGVKPMWIQECPARTDHVMPFCGEAQKQASQKMACAEASGAALQKLERTIGKETSANLKPDGKGGYAFEMTCAGTEPTTLKGVWEDQRWWEEYQGPQGNSYDCWVMLTYPMMEYQNLVGMANKARQDWVGKSTALHQEGQGLASDSRHAEAVVLFERAQKLLTCLKQPLITPDGANSNLLNEQILADLKTSREEAAKVEKTVLVVVRLNQDGNSLTSGGLVKSLRNKLKGWLSGKGLRIRPGGLSRGDLDAVLSGDRSMAARTAAKKGAGLLLVLDLESEYLSYDDAHYAQARGGLRLIRTADGRELATADLGPEKQGHPFTKKGALKLCVEKLRDKFLGQVVESALGKI